MKRIVVTGMGVVSPIGIGVNEFWNNAKAGKSGAGPITRYDASAFRTKFACEVKNFEPLNYMEKAEARKLDLFTQYAFAAADECIKHSAIDLQKANLTRMGVVWGSGMGGMVTYEEGMEDFYKNNKAPRFSPLFIPRIIPNITSGQLSIRYRFQGPSYATAAACTSSNNAIIDAFNLLQLGYADAMLAGGSEAPICFGPMGGFSAMRALSERNDSPETASRPFDKSRDGFVLGEGAGALFLETLESALARNAKIICELAGCGLASDGYHITAPHPDGAGAVIAMENALKMANVTTADIQYINAHATATPLGDISECKAITKVFGNAVENIQISATKSMTGHLMGAAAVVEAVATIKAIESGIIPPTINFTERDAEIAENLNLTPNIYIQKEVNAALNNTFGFGGHIGTTLYKKYEN